MLVGSCCHTCQSCYADEWLPILCDYLVFLFAVFTTDTWARHCDEIASDTALQRAVIQVLMDRCLPAMAEDLQAVASAGLLAHGTGWQMLLRFRSVLHHSSLRAAVERRRQEPGAATAVRHAAAILSLLPTSRSGPMPGIDFSLLLMHGTSLLGMCLGSMFASQAASLEGGSAALSEASGTELAAARWQAVRLLPRLAAGLAAELDDPQAGAGISAWLANLSGVCAFLAWPVVWAYTLHLDRCSPAQLAALLAAVTASLRLLPSLSALDGRLKQHNRALVGAEVCCTSAMQQLAGKLPLRVEQILRQLQQADKDTASLPIEVVAAWGSLTAPLWALHTSLCRLVAALTAPVAPLSLPGVPLDAQAWHQLLFSLNASLQTVVMSKCLAQQCHAHPGGTTEPCLEESFK